MTAADVTREGKEGRDAVLACFKELRTAGYMVTQKMQDASGRWRTEIYVYDTPQSTEVGKPDAGKPGPGLPESGYPDFGGPGAIKNDNLEETIEETTEKKAAAAPTAPATKKKRGDEVVRNGVELWTASDFQHLEKLVERHGAATINEIAAQLPVLDGHQAPLVSAILKALQAAERAARDAAASNAAQIKKQEHEDSVLPPEEQRKRAARALSILLDAPTA